MFLRSPATSLLGLISFFASLARSDVGNVTAVTRATFTYTVSGSIYSLRLPPSSTNNVTSTPSFAKSSAATTAPITPSSTIDVLVFPIVVGGSTFTNSIPRSEYNPIPVPSMTAVIVATAVTVSSGISAAPIFPATERAPSSSITSLEVSTSGLSVSDSPNTAEMSATPSSGAPFGSMESASSLPATSNGNDLSTVYQTSAPTGSSSIQTSQQTISGTSQTSQGSDSLPTSTSSVSLASSGLQSTTAGSALASSSSSIETTMATMTTSESSRPDSSTAESSPATSTASPSTSSPDSTISSGSPSPANTNAPPSNGVSGAGLTRGQTGGSMGIWLTAGIFGVIMVLA